MVGGGSVTFISWIIIWSTGLVLSKGETANNNNNKLYVCIPNTEALFSIDDTIFPSNRKLSLRYGDGDHLYLQVITQVIRPLVYPSEFRNPKTIRTNHGFLSFTASTYLIHSQFDHLSRCKRLCFGLDFRIINDAVTSLNNTWIFSFFISRTQTWWRSWTKVASWGKCWNRTKWVYILKRWNWVLQKCRFKPNWRTNSESEEK